MTGELITPEMLRTAAGLTASMPQISKRSMYHQNVMNLAASVLPIVTQHVLSNPPEYCDVPLAIADCALDIAKSTIAQGEAIAANWKEP